MRQTVLITLFLFSIQILWAGNPTPSSKAFVKNEGQIRTTEGATADAVQYLWSSHNGLNVQFKNSGLSFDTYQKCNDDGSILFHRMDLDFIGANSEVQLLARNRSVEELNVIRGGEKFEKIGLYEELIYKNVYENIDIIAHSGGTHFKYDFVLKEGAQVSDLKLEYKGFDSYRAEAGAITFSLSGKEMTESIPESWLSSSGERIEVEYQIVEKSKNSIIVGFVVCDDSHIDKTMVIDPEVVPEWSTYHGDSLYDTANAIVTDSLGFIFIAGTTESIEMIASAGSYQNTYAGGESDAYLTRMNQHGLRQWSTYYGGSGADESKGLCIDNYNRIYLVGETNSQDSIANEESQQSENGGLNDGFIAAFSRFGNLIWDTYIGGANDDQLCDCFAFNNGKVIALGTTQSPQLFLENGFVPNTTHAGGMDVFLSSFNSQGALTNGSFFGGTGDEMAVAIDINSEGELFAAANTNTPSGLSTPEAYSQSLQGGSDGLIIKMDTLFGISWSSYFGGAGNDFITDIDAENESEIFYIGGYTNGVIDLTVDTASAQMEPGGMEDGFVAKLSENAMSEWFTYTGGPQNDRIVSIELDIDTSLYVVGTTESDTNIVFFDEDSVPSEFSGQTDSYLARYDSEGPRVYSMYLGGEGIDLAEGIAVYGRTAYFVVGSTTSEENMVLTSDQQEIAHQNAYTGGGADAFFSRYTGLYSTDPCIDCGGVGGGGGGGGSGGGLGGGGGEPPGPPAVCIGDSIKICVNGGALGQGAEWIWYLDSCGGTDDFFDEGWCIWVTPDTTTTYYVRGESVDKVSGCASITVLVEYPFEITASVTDSICAGEPLIFTADSALTYEWIGPDTIAFEGSPYSLDSASAYNLGWYHVTGTGLACVDHDSVEVSLIYPNPFLTADLFDPTCVGLSDGSITVNDSDTTITDFYWTDTQSDALFRDSLADGFYPFTAENIYGCVTNSGFALNEPVNPIDSISFTPDTCNQSIGTANVFLTNGWMENFDLAWSSGLDSNVINPQNLPAGQYYIEAYNIYGCTFEDSLAIGNYGEFSTSISADSLYLEFLQSEAIEVFNSPEQEDPTYLWTPEDGLSCSDCGTPVVDPAETTWYFLVVTSELGCTATDSLYVEREIPPPTSFVPTIFSPNNDGVNDQLCVLGNRILEVDFAVYNRWGEEVFATKQLESCWDGKYNGQPVSGALVYTFKAVLEEGKTVEESGNIQILR